MRKFKNERVTSLLIINELIKIRNENNLTQHAVLCDTGIHVGRLEKCKIDFKISTFLKLLNYYNVRVGHFWSRIIED